MTDEAIAGAPTTEFRIGRVLSVSLRGLLRNFAPFILLSLICSIPSLIFNYENPAVQRILSGDAAALPAPDQLSHRYLFSALSLVVSTLCYALTQSALIFGTIQDLSGQRAGFGQILSRGVATMLPVLGAALLMTLGMMAGT